MADESKLSAFTTGSSSLRRIAALVESHPCSVSHFAWFILTAIICTIVFYIVLEIVCATRLYTLVVFTMTFGELIALYYAFRWSSENYAKSLDLYAS